MVLKWNEKPLIIHKWHLRPATTKLSDGPYLNETDFLFAQEAKAMGTFSKLCKLVEIGSWYFDVWNYSEPKLPKQ